MTRVVFPRKLSQSTEAAPGPASTPSTHIPLSYPKEWALVLERGARSRPRLEARQKNVASARKIESPGEFAVGPDVGQRRKFGAPFSVAPGVARSLLGTPSSSYADYLDCLECLECLES